MDVSVIVTAVLTLVACAPANGAALAWGAASECRVMRDTSAIPAGWHPVTVRWQADDPENDLVCISKTEGKQIVAWNGFRLPETTTFSDLSLNDRFQGCAQWSEWQGNNWVMNVMQKNPR